MASLVGVDSLLRMVADYDADELRLSTDGPPGIFKRGAPVRLSIPPTSDETLRLLLGPLLSPERETAIRAGEKAELVHVSAGGQTFVVSMRRQAAGAPTDVALALEIVFRRQAAGVARPAQPSPPATVTAMPTRRAAAPSSVVAPAVVAERASDPSGSTVSDALRTLLQRATAAGASDLHLCARESPSVRVDGSLRLLADEPPAALEKLLAGVVDEASYATIASGRSVDLPLDVPGIGRFRINLYRAAGRLAAAVRLLPLRAPSLAELHMPVPLEDLIAVPHGLVVVCGPAGSGKSATLAALAEAALATSAQRGRARLLITLEDPVEYAIRPAHGGLVRQRQIGSDVRDFPTGLRDALREDPDILLIGEMRDPDTIGLAMTAAETGHLVLTSLHSRSASSSIERIVDSYPAGRQQQIRVQLADALRAIVAQRLIPSASGAGRLPAVEILRANASVASLIREGKTAQITTVIQSSRKEGMLPLERCLADLVRSGHIERDQAIDAANDVLTLRGYLTG
ncbi:MAG: Twitching motility protein PilT [bacterium]|nr:Twitching motility protein PilT [bacterium]